MMLIKRGSKQKDIVEILILDVTISAYKTMKLLQTMLKLFLRLSLKNLYLCMKKIPPHQCSLARMVT